MHDIAVIGAGPAGSIAARRLAERGHDVVLLEEHAETGLPVHCTGLLGFEAFDEFELPRETILGRASAARFWAANGTSVLVQSDRVKAAVIDRVGLDQALASRAVTAGAELRRGWRAERIAVEPRRVVIAGAEGQNLEARACVLACGASYRFHGPLGLGLPRAYMQSAQVEAPAPRRSTVEVRFGRQVAPGGFAWLVPFSRASQPYARIGLVCSTGAGQRFEAFTRDLSAELGIDPGLLSPPRRRLLPLAPVSKTFASRILAVGDAAGLVKPMTGGGIYYGLLSGAMAANVLDPALRADRLGERELKRYETTWRRRLGSEIRMAMAFRHLVERLDDGAISSLIELARVDGVVTVLEKTASFNWHRKAAVALLSHTAFRRIVLRSLCT